MADRRRLPLRQRPRQARGRPNAPARPILAMPRPCAPCSRKTCSPAISTPTLGAPWIPETDIQAFAADLFHVPSSAIQISHLKKDALWTLDADASARQSVAATADYGTPRISGVSLLEQALNLKTPVIYDTIDNDGKEERVVNQGGHARRPRKAKADQGAVSLVGLRRSGAHRAPGAALQRHLQQPAPSPLRRLTPRFSPA